MNVLKMRYIKDEVSCYGNIGEMSHGFDVLLETKDLLLSSILRAGDLRIRGVHVYYSPQFPFDNERYWFGKRRIHN